MRLLVLSNFFPPVCFGGYEIRCADVVRELRLRGHTVSVLTSSLDRGRCGPESYVHRRLPRPAVGWRATRPLLFAYNALANARLRSVMRATRPELVSVWNLAGLPQSLLGTLTREGVPVCLYVEDDWLLQPDPWLTSWGSRRPWLRGLKKRLRGRVESLAPTERWNSALPRFVFTSRFRRARHASAGLPVEDAAVIYGGIPVVDLPFDRHLNFSAENPPRRLLQVGAIVRAKGQDLAVEALARLRRRGVDVELSLIGTVADSGYLAELRDLARQSGVGPALHVLPRVERGYLGRVYATHDILVFASRGPEGFPLSIFEAMACGLPVVTTATGGHAEVLENDRNALVVDAVDAALLAEQIERVCTSVDLARRLGAAGQALVRGCFDIGHMVDELEREFRSLTG